MTVYKCDICKKELELGKTTICHIVRIDTCKHLDLCEECYSTLESVAEALKRGEPTREETPDFFEICEVTGKTPCSYCIKRFTCRGDLAIKYRADLLNLDPGEEEEDKDGKRSCDNCGENGVTCLPLERVVHYDCPKWTPRKAGE